MLKPIIAILFIAIMSVSANDDFKFKFNKDDSPSMCEEQLNECHKKCDEIKGSKKEFQKCEDKCEEDFEACIANEQ